MTIEDKRRAIVNHCISISTSGCQKCNLYHAIPTYELCYGKDADIERNYSIIFGENPYWERITELAERQRKKGMSKYGFGLEMNPAAIVERINHLEEELIDGLMYCEWIKEKING